MDGQTNDARAQGGEGRALKRAGLLAAVLAVCVASACQGRGDATSAVAPVAPPLIDGTPSDAPAGLVVLSKGMKADIGPGATLSFEAIVSDSRCPAGAQCVWAGEVTIALKLATPLGSKGFELSDRDNRRSALSYAVELVSYGPCPGGPAITPLPGECATLRVTTDPSP